MNLQDYLQGALTTESKIEKAKVNDIFAFRAVLEAFTAAADLLDLYKKNIYYGKPINADKWHDAMNRLTQARTDLGRGTYLPLTYSSQDVLHIDPRILHSIVGIATESGELTQAVLNQLNYRQDVDLVNLQEEFGDLAWYQAIGVDAMGADWEQILETNNKKLAFRNKGKQFNAEATINRDVEAERKILEEGSNG